jgi:hypothetical protein
LRARSKPATIAAAAAKSGKRVFENIGVD